MTPESHNNHHVPVKTKSPRVSSRKSPTARRAATRRRLEQHKEDIMLTLKQRHSDHTSSVSRSHNDRSSNNNNNNNNNNNKDRKSRTTTTKSTAAGAAGTAAGACTPTAFLRPVTSSSRKRQSKKTTPSSSSPTSVAAVIVPVEDVVVPAKTRRTTLPPKAPTLTTTAKIAANTRSVRFNKRVRIRKIRKLADTPRHELEATYYTDKELTDIRNALRAMIRVLVEHNFKENVYDDDENIDFEDDEIFCIRGLEHELPRGKTRRKQNKLLSRAAVLEEQRQHREFSVVRAAADLVGVPCDEDEGGCEDPASVSSAVREDRNAAISEIYQIESRQAVQLALDFAKRDEYVADKIYMSRSFH
eukprot:CAMPEP_0201121922 /NCGR_PEP_ID=MMETSP0850-20130426/5678_1 /ASSEMBLY_ACC=CAM_ASM_000622 /TAXON_ID=183588 /ORGANISM="Pseudo-nitzschia fraudulenta, Strain WWA7" /LENGTH=358 /DNA_ID=CAMNT_0047388489 /DNA_START=402 /DNA_END=1478 /DNA_ORIENTATION=+